MRTAGLPWLLGAVLLTFIPCLTSATELNTNVTYFSVTFDPVAAYYEPEIRDSTVRILDVQKSITLIEALAPAVFCQPIIRRGSSAYSVAGPWRIGLIGVDDPEAKLAEILADPHVDYTSLIASPDSPVLGEAAKAEYPDLQVRTDFCWQSQLQGRFEHATIPDGDPCIDGPTLNWNHDSDMDLPQAWAITQGDSNIIVAVADVGIEWTHPGMGGVGPAVSVPDSLPYYNSGAIYRNWREQLGDANGDGSPGIQGIDDDGDGRIDEDSLLREPDNAPEPDVQEGTITAVQDTTITDSNANYAVNALVGLRLYPNWDYNGYYAEVVGNTATTITTRRLAIDYFGTLYYLTFLQLPYVVFEGAQYRVGNGLDDDGDGDMDDDGYQADLTMDDDENSYNDDLHGYDFLDMAPPGTLALANEDYTEVDSDPRSVGGHGTTVASMIATSPLAPRIGIAPLVKILPIRAGYATVDPNTDPLTRNACGRQLVADGAMIEAVAFARDMNADILVTAAAGYSYEVVNGIMECTQQGMFHSAGTALSLSGLPGSVLVVGVNDLDEANDSRGYYAYTDVAARNSPLLVVDCRVSCPISNRYAYSEMMPTTPSLSGGVVAGVAALMKSAYPHWGVMDIRNKMLCSVDDIYTIPEDPDLNAAYEAGQLLGSGRVSAYKALTFYGKVGTVSADTTWTNKVWVSGDIEVPEGATLRVAPGTQIFMAQDDILAKGTSPNRPEFLVKGTVLFQGTAEAPIVIDMLRDEASTNRWGPFMFSNSEAKTRGVFEHVIFRHAHQVAVKGPVPLVDRVALRFEGCSFEDVAWGADMRALALGDTLEVSNCTFRGLDTSTGVAIYAEAAATDSNYAIRIDNGSVIKNYGGGVELVGHRQALVTDCVIDSCGIGVYALGLDNSGPTIGPNVTVTNPSWCGGATLAGAPLFTGVAISGSGSYGIYAGNGAQPVFAAPASTVSGCALDGVVLEDVANTTRVTNVNISNCGNSGIRVVGCAPRIAGPVDIQYCANAGVYCDAASPVIDGVTMSGNYLGLNATNTSAPTLRRSRIANGTHGVMANETDTPDIGLMNDFGTNAFNQITGYFGVNFNNSAPLMMIGNCYNGKTNPKPTKFGGSNVTLYSPGYCQ